MDGIQYIWREMTHQNISLIVRISQSVFEILFCIFPFPFVQAVLDAAHDRPRLLHEGVGVLLGVEEHAFGEAAIEAIVTLGHVMDAREVVPAETFLPRDLFSCLAGVGANKVLHFHG